MTATTETPRQDTRPDARPRWWAILRFALIALAWVLTSAGAILWGAAQWIRRTFGPVSIDQMLTNLPGAGGAEATAAEGAYVSSFVWQAIVAPVCIVSAVFVLLILAHRATRRRSEPDAEGRTAPAARAMISRAAGVTGFRYWSFPLIVIGAITVGAIAFSQAIGVPQYQRSLASAMTLNDYYVAPVVAGGAETRNLVLIYLESIEDGLADDTVFEENMLAPVQRATRGWRHLDALHQFDGGGWTMAGIVGTQCGIPLRGTQTSIEGELDVIGKEENSYMPGAVCLGDVLAEAGYRNVFMGGADTGFASKEDFLRSHGYDEVLGLHDWEERGETEFSDWGLSDRALFERAKDEVTRLHESGRPFDLTLLTLDTHDPARLFDHCPLTTEVEMTSITRCSMEAVADFIAFLGEEGILDDTVVVLMGDHEKFISDTSDYQELADLEERTIFHRIWSPDGFSFGRDEADQLSMFATVLDLLGFEVERQRAGIGVSVLADDDDPESILALGADRYAEVLQSRSADLFQRIWAITETTGIDPDYFDPKNPPPRSGSLPSPNFPISALPQASE